MKLPHKEPLVFAKEIVSLTENQASILCEFEKVPSLAMFIEASAQSSAAFFQEGNYQIGFLVNAKNIEWNNKSNKTQFIINLILEVKFESMSNYKFIVTDIMETSNICSGEFTVSIQ